MDILVAVLKWVFIILIAGFIGQFGKSLSLNIIDYYKKKKEKGKSADPIVTKGGEKKAILSPKELDGTMAKGVTILSQEGDSQTEREVLQEQDSKIEKKAIKAQLKAMKKIEKAKQKETE